MPPKLSVVTRPLIFNNHFHSTGVRIPPSSFSTTISTGAVSPEAAIQQLLELRRQEAYRLKQIAASDDVLRNRLLERQQHLSDMARAIEQTQRFSRFDDVFRSSSRGTRTEPLYKVGPATSKMLTPEEEKELLKKNESERKKFGAEIYKETYGEEPTSNILDTIFPKTAAPLGDDVVGDKSTNNDDAKEKLKQLGEAIKSALGSSAFLAMPSGIHTNPMMSNMLGNLLKQETSQTQAVFAQANRNKRPVIKVNNRLIPIRRKRQPTKTRR